ncbi:hypothetical protein BH10PSE14_BH10PSE14_04620 [soil metagenome]
MTPTPGAWLKLRRQAARLSIADVAAMTATEPRVAEHVRAGWLDLIEADAMPASFATIVALRHAYPFDLHVLEQLVAISLGAPLPAPRLCRICGCSEHDPCEVAGAGCWWVRGDVCSACSPDTAPAPPAPAADRDPA